MFAGIRSEILDRIFSTKLLATAAAGLTMPRTQTAAKGLAFVQLYATYEFTIIESVRATLIAATAHRIELRRLQSGLQALALDAEITSIADSKKRASWPRRLQLFDKAISDAPAAFPELFPDDGSHFKVDQLRTLWSLFNLQCPVVPDGRMIGRIAELVTHRNAIAHGRITAED